MKNATKLICGEVWGNNIYVVCECGQEIVEFAEDAGEFFLQYHGWYNNKRDELPMTEVIGFPLNNFYRS